MSLVLVVAEVQEAAAVVREDYAQQ